jgi:hypothetical protein
MRGDINRAHAYEAEEGGRHMMSYDNVHLISCRTNLNFRRWLARQTTQGCLASRRRIQSGASIARGTQSGHVHLHGAGPRRRVSLPLQLGAHNECPACVGNDTGEDQQQAQRNRCPNQHLAPLTKSHERAPSLEAYRSIGSE